MAKNTSVNLDITNDSVGFTLIGGTSKRSWSIKGTGDQIFTAQQAINLTLPNRASDTIVGYGDFSAKGVILVGTGSGTFTALGVGTNGYQLTADSAQTSGVKWAPAAGSAAGVTSWENVTAATKTMVSSTGYFANNASAVAFTLPATAAQFEYLEIVGIQGSWNIIQGAGQSIVFGNVTTTVGAGGSLSSSVATDNVLLQCIVADTTWQVVRSFGNINYA